MARPARFARFAVISAAFALASSCVMDRAPEGIRRTPAGSGPTIRFDLAHKPLPEIPIPNDVATWADPTSRTGLRINASLVAPTSIEKKARVQFSKMEGWGTFAPMWVSFDVDRSKEGNEDYAGPALDLANVKQRHQGDDYDFANDAVYLVNLDTGVPVPLDLGNGNFDYTLKRLDSYWPNDARRTERNLLFDTIDETQRGAITPATFLPEHDTDRDGTLDVPNLDDPFACPDPDPVCDDPADATYTSPACTEKRRLRDRCVADHLLTFYERETDTLILRPVLPLDEMTRYAVVLTDRLVDGNGQPVRSPFDFVYHASMETTAARVAEVLNDGDRAAYFGDLAGTGLDRVAFTWSFTTQPTVDDMLRLRDGLFGTGPFARWATDYPPTLELQRAVGLYAGLSSGEVEESPDWRDSDFAKIAKCDEKLPNLHLIHYDDIKDQMELLLSEGFGVGDGPALQLLLKGFESIDYMLVGSFRAPFLLEGGPGSTDPNAAFDLDYVTGQGEETSDVVQFWLMVPKQTEEHKQPFDVNIYGHGYTGNFAELVFYAGNMAEHGIATIGINAMGHGFVLDESTSTLATALLAGTCVAPFFDALTSSRARDLNRDGVADSGGDFWSSYLFHTRDGVRQSILDHLQLVRILRGFGQGGQMLCRTAETGWDQPATEPCDVNDDGKPEIAGDFDGDGTPDVGGPTARFGTWGESLGGILSAIHGAIDTNVTTAVPGSGGGGLTDIGVRSFQGGVIEAVLLRIWGPLLVTVPAGERPACEPGSEDGDHCTLCTGDQASLRWVVPDLNDTGEIEITCLDRDEIENTTVIVYNADNRERKCASVGSDLKTRIGLPASIGDRLEISIYEGKDGVSSYASCASTAPEGTKPRRVIRQWGKGRHEDGALNGNETASCNATTCASFQGVFFGEGTDLIAPAEGYGLQRQTPALRRFLTLAQAALDPGDPVSFAPYYSIKPMTDPTGAVIPPHAVLTLNTIGDMNVPLNTGIAFARASGALPFMRPEHAITYPELAGYATPAELYSALGGRTPNQELIDNHVIEGITELARHPAGSDCATSANAKDANGTFPAANGEARACYPDGCTPETESDGNTRKCHDGTACDFAVGKCVPRMVGAEKCEEALFDVDDLDEGSARFFEQNAKVPHRLARYTEAASAATLDIVWQPRLKGVPFGPDGTWTPNPARPLTALLDAYIVPDGVHTFVNGEPCQSFDAGNYLTNLTARFFQSGGTDLYYLSHPATHLCLAEGPAACGY